MPRYNGTGPLGAGPGTGWGMGPCGAGMGLRRRRGKGWGGCGFGRFWGQPQITKKEETEMLTEEAGALEDELKAIKERIVELKGKNNKV
ncbi:DUF5320 domain-containing protein [Patescibacteria group bacterium]